MMKYFLRIFSYVFHPLFIPLLGTLLYFKITPKFVPENFLYAKLMAITILTVIVPVLFYFMLRNLGKIDSVFVEDVKQRRIPLFFQIILVGIILFMVVRGYEFPELFYFFMSILTSAIIAFLAALLNYKVSLHMMGIAGLLFFIIALSVYYHSNLLLAIEILFFISGAVASSRLEQNAHTTSELMIGMLIGGLPQLGVLLFL